MPYPDYRYNDELGSCYKVYLTPRNWTEAYRTCASELSYLTIIDSPGEKDFFLEHLENARPEGDYGLEYQQGQFFVGIHQLTGEGWRTVKGAPFKVNKEYVNWHGKGPDSNGVEKCGSVIFNQGVGLNDIGCHRSCFFICEHDVDGSDVIPPYLSFGVI